jgi:TonB family protein
VKRTILAAACVLSMSASGCAKKDPAPPAPKPAAATAVGMPVGPNVRQPVKLKDVPARYPAAAREARIQGVVMMDLTIDDTGHVAEAKVIGGPLELHEAAYQAAMQWVYSPTLVNGVPTAITMRATVSFRLQ